MCKKTKAFTLIELLVVIAIIALLLAVILPALKAAKSHAKRIVCMAHMKGMGTLVLTYAQENEDELVSCESLDFPNDRGTAYYSYYQDFHPISRGGPSGLGWLFKAGLIESESDLPFCPATHYLFGMIPPTKNWHPKGKVEHWNYCGNEANSGIDSGNAQILWDKDAHIGWFPLRLSVGTRILRRHRYDNGTGAPLPLSDVDNSPLNNFKTISQAASKGKRAFMSDHWVANFQGWQSQYKSITHASGGKRSLNYWRLDGSANNVKMEDEWFESTSTTGDSNDRLMKADVTWSTMFD